MIQSAVNQTLGIAAAFKKAGEIGKTENKTNALTSQVASVNENLATLTAQVDEMKAKMANANAVKLKQQKKNIKQKSFRGKATLNAKDLRLVGGGK